MEIVEYYKFGKGEMKFVRETINLLQDGETENGIVLKLKEGLKCDLLDAKKVFNHFKKK